MIIAVASGKGGTGKTTVATNLALAIENVQFIDCDVEEPNAHLFLNPQIKYSITASIPMPQINDEKCTWCGKCSEVCAYNCLAVIKPSPVSKGKVLVFPNLCHGCGACTALCPEKAINEIGREIGVIKRGSCGSMDLIYGTLNVGEAMAPPVIRQCKGLINKEKTVIIDAPPGTSCPVISAVKGADFCLLVSEPTPFGLNDLRLAVETLRTMNIPFGVVLNRADIGDEESEKYCSDNGIHILMRIPFDEEIAGLYSRGKPIVGNVKGYDTEFKGLFGKIKELLEKRI